MAFKSKLLKVVCSLYSGGFFLKGAYDGAKEQYRGMKYRGKENWNSAGIFPPLKYTIMGINIVGGAITGGVFSCGCACGMAFIAPVTLPIGYVAHILKLKSMSIAEQNEEQNEEQGNYYDDNIDNDDDDDGDDWGVL